MAYNNKNEETISTSLFQETKFSEDPEKNRIFSIQGLNYGIYFSLKAMDKDRKFKNNLGGFYAGKDLFGSIAKMFELAAEKMGNEFYYEVESKKGKLGVKSEKVKDTLLVSVIMEDKESNKKAQFFLPLRDAVKDVTGGQKVNAAYVMLVTISQIFATVATSSNIRWERHSERVHAVMEKSNPGGNKNSPTVSEDDYSY